MKNKFTLLSILLILGVVSYFGSQNLMGKKPTNPHTSNSQEKAAFDAIDKYAGRLKENPSDTEALLALGDISFDFKVFDKALDYYTRYLKLKPEDLEVKARFASTLTFVGQLDEAEKELKSILKNDPKNFQAHAYLAVTLAEKGEIEKAKKSGEVALSYAPSDEAKARLSTFLGSLNENAKGESAKDNNNTSDPLEVNLRSVPMIGDKLVRIERNKSQIKIYFRDFPMEGMPPMARAKFFERIKKFLKSDEEAVFIDEPSGRVMEKISHAL